MANPQVQTNKKSDEWARKNTDNPDIPKKWLRNEFYGGSKNDITRKRINNCVDGGGPLSPGYRDNYDKIFRGNESSSDIEQKKVSNKEIKKVLDLLREIIWEVECTDGLIKLYDRTGGLIATFKGENT